ncbi:MAG: DSBA oxidoreductase [Candidatus Magasanikbacteria bacterium GW2011_GWA2_56_11]|uniref:DSBA oxidoreductase n=1 Tax=Candidatus Magasanikbacteria bacterium GW2011_GWA2_56_11 TaxID=1619044 RepID=A0A0G2BBC7_9BACT|nr:MAG: DSBA oxidoreductase [Candidatus Magasanikbacteria bacterium GW2011_GWA2_56_11]
MNPNTRRILIWSAFTLGLVGLLFGLAKLGTSGQGASPAAGLALAVPVTDEDWSKGNKDAPVTVVEYSDFQCPACQLYYKIVKQISEDMPDKVRFVYRHYPLRQTHPNAEAASLASEAAGMQGKFWQLHDALFETQDSWARDTNPAIYFEDLASSLGLDVKKFKEDMKSPAAKNKVDRDYRSGAGIEGTPTFFVNGRLVNSPRSYEEFKTLVEQAAQPS